MNKNQTKYYREDGGPLQCPFCDSIEFHTRTCDIIANTPCEVGYICDKCDEIIGFWVYGHFDPAYVNFFNMTPDELFEL